MADYLLQFGVGNPANFTGLTPTFLVFKTTPGGVNATPPGITELPTATGLYYFTYGATNTVSFVVDGFTNGLNDAVRYISGEVSPLDEVNVQLTNQGTTLVAFGNSFLAMGASFTTLLSFVGNSASSFGNTSADPQTIFGYLKRLQEFNEGNSVFTKNSGLWSIYSRGSSYLLADKTLADTSTSVTKT